MASEFQTKLDEWTEWYAFHRNNGGDVLKQIAFLKRSHDMTLHLLHLANLEIKKAQGKASDHLWLPENLKVRGDLSRFG